MTSLAPLSWRCFRAPKAGHTLAEYEDALAVEPATHRFAIADGASESAFADSWARILVESYVLFPGSWSDWLPAARDRWMAEVGDRELPWYAETKVQEGAYAAMLGIAFKGRRWRATAVGDCCVFQVRGQGLLRGFPIRDARQFDNRPSLVGSQKRQAGEPRARRIHANGALQSGDTVFLMTDALAQWFLKEAEAGQQPWSRLRSIGTDAQFVECLTSLRDTKGLRNDDVTMTLIECLPS